MTSFALEEILKAKIIEDKEESGKWDKIQKGFPKDRSCQVNLLSLSNKVTDLLDKGFMIHLFCAAYDTASHRKWGIRRRVVKWIRDCLMDRWQLVVLKVTAANCRNFVRRNSQKSVWGSIRGSGPEEKQHKIYSFH